LSKRQFSNLTELFQTAPKDRVCLIDDSRTLSYGEVEVESSEVANALREEYGVHNGDRVALFLPNCWQFVVSFYAVLKARGIVVPIDFRSSKREFDFFLENCGASVLFLETSKESYLSENAPNCKIVRVNADSTKKVLAGKVESVTLPDSQNETMCILYTGGTTGLSKGAELTHKNFLSVLSGLAEVWNLGKKGQEVFAQFLPMTHSGGLNCNLNSALYCGGKTILMRKFNSKKLLQLIERHEITAFAGVPTVFNALVKEPDLEQTDISSLRICFSSGAPLSKEIAETFYKRTGIVIDIGWGLTEASPQLSVVPMETRYRPNYVGIPLSETEIVAVEELTQRPLPNGSVGELAAKGPQIMKGYWNNNGETLKVFTKDGFLLTGDVGYVAKDGVYLLGRKKDQINSGGYKIWPHEVENVLMENAHVQEVAVVGTPDPLYGETVKAFIVLKSPTSEEELRAFCKVRLSSFKVPKSFEFMDTLPKSSVGKILHRALRQ